ncbi:delta D isoform X4 [Paramuricea clavata]|uniref:Delta D isoform X4 n=1 Tax=Paramuricea clavata TaxID=317549 RepID=A0A6S7I041_PARCT|nr:delta D isoform X4 [Paramuricea clavata]
MKPRMRVEFLIVFAVCRYFPISMSIELDCHREQKFVKAEQDGLPAVNAIQVMTTSNVEFCTIKCLDNSGCKSIVYLLSNSDDNCLLSDEINGAQSSNASVTYIKTSQVTSVCQTNICEHGSTCTDVCTPPYYHCTCLPLYFEGERCEQNSKCEKMSPCQNSGTCSPSQVNPFYTCSCPTYFTGTNCEINTRCYNSPCYNGGHCYTKSAYPYFDCSCPGPFSGSTCAINTRCNANPCQHGGTCYTQNHHPYFICACPTGRWGDVCEKNLLAW